MASTPVKARRNEQNTQLEKEYNLTSTPIKARINGNQTKLEKEYNLEMLKNNYGIRNNLLV
ncbi:MAG: hypothetical protein ACOX47_03460 [Bacillota bacterium]|jgi:hypothetical protein